MKYLFYLVLVIFLSACKIEKKPLVFIVPGKLFFEQQTIAGVSKMHKVNFDQYLGYYFYLKDSIFDKICLVTNSQNLVSSDVISTQKQNQIKKETIQKLKIQYLLDTLKSKEFFFDQLKEVFNKFRFSQTDSTLTIFDKCGERFVLIEYNNIYIPNCIIELNPIKESCIE